MTVAIAWLAAIWLPSPPEQLTARTEAPTARIAGLAGGQQLVFSGVGFARTECQVHTVLGGATMQVANVGQYGFPFRALDWQQVFDSGTRREVPHGVLNDGLRLASVWRPYMPHGRGFRSTLPLRPCWRGMIADCVFYALLLAGLAGGWRCVRTVRRRRSGSCLRCGYRVGGLPICPECGHR